MPGKCTIWFILDTTATVEINTPGKVMIIQFEDTKIMNNTPVRCRPREMFCGEEAGRNCDDIRR